MREVLSEEELHALYEDMKGPLYSFLFRYTHEEQFSIDLVQETFERVKKYEGNYNQEKGSMKNYLFQVAYRLLITKLNRRKTFRRILPFLYTSQEKTLDTADQMTVRDAVLALPDKQRAVIILTYYHDLTQVEIGSILEIPVGTVKSRLHKATATLKEALKEDFR
ncbi:sigma-70 family RNA polymerase sigma factor [Paenalkalicoccus suaedae]|uniref:Sigma-70 family RNA polymerase sigma factor n=1 Tax=Paenalkalicoccus suaedae TaxID=2592382 RepID=A0A859FK15_9BACI|nr:sigma-70 family RNA polymerase sigma factor [Paenalkalicoccus suaedae]